MAREAGVPALSERLKWFQEARFGMFVHWGLFSVVERERAADLGVMRGDKWAFDEYASFADRFLPKKGFAEEWVKLAQDAGVKYITLTTKHIPGFALFKSNVSDFSAPKSAAGRDVVEEFANACHKAKMRIGFYYALPDPSIGVLNRLIDKKTEPELYRRWTEKTFGQVRELLTQYGRIDELWFDNSGYKATPEPHKLMKLIRELQPWILVNDRTCLPGDFDTPEQHVTASKPGRAWEACMTIGDHWQFDPEDKNWKSPWVLVKYLGAAVSGGGNFLLNVSPAATGKIPVYQVSRLKEVGKWLERNGESIYGAGRAPFGGQLFGSTTAKGNTVYMHMHYWQGPHLRVFDVKQKVTRAWILGTGQEINFRQEGEVVYLLGMPAKAPDKLYAVIALKLKA